MINSGINRYSTRQALTVLEKDVLKRQPDLVFVMFGINDQDIPNGGTPDGYQVPPEQYAANLERMITEIQAIGAKVVLMTNRPLVQGPSETLNTYLNRHGDGGALYTLPGKTKATVRLYNDIVRQKAREHGTYLVDIWQAIVDQAGSDRDEDVLKLNLDRPQPYFDGVHLGPGGAIFYAQTILKTLETFEGVPVRAEP